MNELLAAIRQFFRGLRPWVLVSPWEQAVRIRCGRYVCVLDAGMHLRLPIVDVYYLQSVRLRVSGLGRHTVTCRDGITITFNGAIGYVIDNIERLYQTLHHAEDTISHLVRAQIAGYIAGHDLRECSVSGIESFLNNSLRLEQYGLKDGRAYITEFAVVRTFRLIGDYGAGWTGAALNTEQPHGSSGGPA